MATLEQIGTALKAADAAGNTADAKRLAAAYVAMRNQQPAAPQAQQPTAPPQSIGDQLSAGFTSGVNAIPIAGPTILGGLERLKGMVQNRPYQDVAASDQAQTQQNPVASTVGTVAGNVLPFALAPEIPVAGAFAGRALGMTGNLASRMGFGMLSGAGISGADALARGSTPNDALQQAAIGGGLGGAFPLVGAGLRKLVSPMTMTTAQRAAAQTLNREGVDLTAGQRTGSKKLRYLESELGGGAADAIVERQGRQFTAAVLSRAGIAADSADPQTIDQGFTQIGHQFDALAQNNTIQADPRLLADLHGVWRDFSNVKAPSPRAPLLGAAINDIANVIAANNGQIDGAWYKTMRSGLDRAARTTNDPEFGGALRDVNTALDAAMERSIAANNPQDLGAWRTVRRQYKNLLVIEKAATGAGEQTAAGIISPARLRSAAIQQNRRTFARGHNDFTDLANAGVHLMTPLPQSGTVPRAAAHGLFSAVGTALGSPGGIPGMVAGAVAGAAVPAVVGRAALSRAGRAFLSNQLMAGPAGRAFVAPAVPGLLADQSRRPLQITINGGGR